MSQDEIRPCAEEALRAVAAAAERTGEVRAAASLAAAAAVVLSDLSDEDAETWFASVRAARAQMRAAEAAS